MKSKWHATIGAAILWLYSGQIGTAHANAIQFDYLATGYVQEIYTGPIRVGYGVTSAGMAWTSTGNLITKNGNQLQVYSSSTTVHQGTNVHTAQTTYTVAGLDPNVNALGIVNAQGGYIYANTSLGLQRIDPTYSTATTVSTVGGAYGITMLPDGRIAYAGGTGNEIWIYDPFTNTNSVAPVFTSATGTIFDDIEANLTGQIAIADIYQNKLQIINTSGSVLLSILTGAHSPDGIAFVSGSGAQAIMVNNNDGSISRYDFNSGYTSLLSSVDIATTNAGRRAYGDLAACGPDGAFYITQYDVGVRGSDSGFATRWDNGAQTNEASIMRISSSTPGGNLCAATAFSVPEPSHLPILGLSLLCYFTFRRRSVPHMKAGTNYSAGT